MAEYEYAGGELQLFSKATVWKAYWKSFVVPHLTGDVLEIGAGIGANANALADAEFRSWTCLEPDARLAAAIPPGPRRNVVVGTSESIDEDSLFDTILYPDVLEHIEDDRGELARSAALLRNGGSLIVLAPAHPALYTEFDRAIGHCRRYSRGMLRAVIPEGLTAQSLVSLDSVGLLASWGNRLLLRSAAPTPRQIAFWDGVLVRCSRALDPLFQHSVGRSLLGVWRST